jgi:hypothetical protein
MKERRQPIQLLGASCSINLYTSVVFVPDPSANADGIGARMNEPTEPDALNAS